MIIYIPSLIGMNIKLHSARLLKPPQCVPYILSSAQTKTQQARYEEMISAEGDGCTSSCDSEYCRVKSHLETIWCAETHPKACIADRMANMSFRGSVQKIGMKHIILSHDALSG